VLERGQRMKLLHILPSVDPAYGGTTEAVRRISEVCRDDGHTIEIASLDDPECEFVARFPFKVHALGPTQGNYKYAPRFRGWLREHHREYDCVVVHGIWQYQSFGTWQALHRTRTPYVIYTHGMLDPWFKRTYPLKHAKKWLYWPWGEYRVLRDAKAVLFTCEEERDLARESFWLYKAREVVVGLGTSSPDVDLKAAREEFLIHFPELRAKRLALFLGRIHPKKGCDLLIEAFAKTLAAGTVACDGESRGTVAYDGHLSAKPVAYDENWHLIIAGPDSDGWGLELQRRCVELGIDTQVTWTGILNGSLKWGSIAAAEFFILPSHQENFGIAVVEALACNVPVLITDKVNIWKEIQQDDAGLVANDDLDGIQFLFRQWQALSETEREAMRVNGGKCFRDHFEISASARRLLHVIEDICNIAPR
jgi:glycosyltransferase involved in cell wall biosynthesis